MYTAISNFDTRIDIHESFQKRTDRNRTQILGPNGRQLLVVPLKKGKNSLGIKEVEIAYDEDWPTVHLKTLTTAYSTSPYYDYYKSGIEKILVSKPQFLFELNEALMKFVVAKLGTDFPEYTHDFIHPDNFEGIDFRLKFLELKNPSPPYSQVFEHKFGFIPNLSILDLLFNLGPESLSYLRQAKITFE